MPTDKIENPLFVKDSRRSSFRNIRSWLGYSKFPRLHSIYWYHSKFVSHTVPLCHSMFFGYFKKRPRNKLGSTVFVDHLLKSYVFFIFDSNCKQRFFVDTRAFFFLFGLVNITKTQTCSIHITESLTTLTYKTFGEIRLIY